MFSKNKNISIKDGIILLILVGMILLFPWGILQLFGHTWKSVTWQDTTDIAMLEWSGAFFNVFLFLLLVEQFRSSKRLMFIFMACGFLAMGIMNFFYALASPGTESATWIFLFSMLLGGMLFAFSIPFRKVESKFDLFRVLIQYIIPTVLLVIVAIWVNTSLKQLLPHIMTSKGRISLFGQLLFIIPCIFFFFTAQMWLHEYIKNKDRVSLLFAMVTLIYPQMILLIKGADTWGIAWWMMHIILFLNVLIACIYMLVLSIYRSLVWKLILSLGLAFSFTVLLASSIIQSYSKKQHNKYFQLHLHEKNKLLLLKCESVLTFANYALKTVAGDALIFPDTSQGEFETEVKKYFIKQHKQWKDYNFEYGFIPQNGNVISFDQNGMKDQLLQTNIINDFRKKLINYLDPPTPTTSTKNLNLNLNTEKSNILSSLELNNIDSSNDWHCFYYDTHKHGWFFTTGVPYYKRKTKGIFFTSVNLSSIVNSKIITPIDSKKSNGCIIFDQDSRKVICNIMPGTALPNKKNSFNKENLKSNTILRKLIASTIDIQGSGRRMLVNMKGEHYFISAIPLNNLNWNILTMVNIKNFPTQKITNKYFFIAVGMLTLLWGFVFLLLLLHLQLSKPLNRLLNATKELDHGNFDINVEISDNSELGTISKAFNHMIYNMKKSYSDLDKTIQHRTEALQEVKKANLAKVTFFQNVSHELRTPMHGVLSFARLGLKLNIDKHPEKINKYFKNINSSAERLMIMIDSIMDLAKFESGHMTFHFHNKNITPPLHQIEDEFKAALIEKDIKLTIIPPNEAIIAHYDFEMISRVYRNLISNALKMSEKGSTITIEITKDDDYAKVIVSDEGPGIPEEEIKQIFEKFVQAGAGKKRGGTGLGLAICREIISAHNGEIWAQNNDKNGASFIFTLPLGLTKQ